MCDLWAGGIRGSISMWSSRFLPSLVLLHGDLSWIEWDWVGGGLSEIGVGLGARCVRAPLWGLLVRQAIGLLGLDLGGTWNVEWMRMFCFCSGWESSVESSGMGSSGRWAGLGWMD